LAHLVSRRPAQRRLPHHCFPAFSYHDAPFGSISAGFLHRRQISRADAIRRKRCGHSEGRSAPARGGALTTALRVDELARPRSPLGRSVRQFTPWWGASHPLGADEPSTMAAVSESPQRRREGSPPMLVAPLAYARGPDSGKPFAGTLRTAPNLAGHAPAGQAGNAMLASLPVRLGSESRTLGCCRARLRHTPRLPRLGVPFAAYEPKIRGLPRRRPIDEFDLLRPRRSNTTRGTESEAVAEARPVGVVPVSRQATARVGKRERATLPLRLLATQKQKSAPGPCGE
jgi:hypothetical protein